MKVISYLTSCSLLALSGSLRAQLVVNENASPQQVLQDVLLGSGITVSNVTFNDAAGTLLNPQAGSFHGAASVLAMDSGLVMCTGGISVAPGPNDNGGAMVEVLDNFTSDNDLDDVAGDMAMDVAMLEFDFVPNGDSISFDYSFASEEYLEWVNAGYNDAFGFFLSGPGITGPFENDAINLAVVPGSLAYVSVNSINDITNSTYYQDNGDGSTTPYSNDPYYFQFDGFTRGLRASAQVQCGATYHLKLAIGDVGDPNWDSGVFIRGGSFRSTGGLTMSFSTDTLMEQCGETHVTITRANPAGAMTLSIVASGTASNADVEGLPTTITLAEGEGSTQFTLTATEDGTIEPPESLVLSLTYQGPCGSNAVRDSVIIVDHPPIAVTLTNMAVPCSEELFPLVAQSTGGVAPLMTTWTTGAIGDTAQVPGENASYSMTVTDACGISANAAATVIAPCEIIIPNVFSPNGDGSNDLFVISGLNGTRNLLRVFNRWGQTVFEASNYNNQWNGGDLSDGTYYYEVHVEGYGDPFTGHVTILNER